MLTASFAANASADPGKNSLTEARQTRRREAFERCQNTIFATFNICKAIEYFSGEEKNLWRKNLEIILFGTNAKPSLLRKV